MPSAPQRRSAFMSGGHARLTAKNSVILCGASVLRCACISSAELFQIFCFQVWYVWTYYSRRPSSNWNLNFVWPVLAWLLACVFLMNLFVLLFFHALVQSISCSDFQEKNYNYRAVRAIRVVEQDQPCPPIPLVCRQVEMVRFPALLLSLELSIMEWDVVASVLNHYITKKNISSCRSQARTNHSWHGTGLHGKHGRLIWFGTSW